MTLIRRSALEEVGGWAEWCITEDAELGLRLFEAGHRAVYTDKSYGKGLMPDSFVAYQEAALPLGLWRDADHEAALARACCRSARPKLAPAAALPVPGGLAAVDRRRAAAFLHRSGAGLDRGHDPRAQHDAAAADALSHRHPRHVLLQGRQVALALCPARCRAASSTISAPRSPGLRFPIRWRRRSGAASSPTTCRSTARRRWRTRPPSCAASSTPGKRR